MNLKRGLICFMYILIKKNEINKKEKNRRFEINLTF